MKHRSQGWISDICLCGEEFHDRNNFNQHCVACVTQIQQKIANGTMNPNTLDQILKIQENAKELLKLGKLGEAKKK